MAGRKPKPTAIKELEGNPGKRKLNTKEPIPAKGKQDLRTIRSLRIISLRDLCFPHPIMIRQKQTGQ
ncbi:MAG: hypothetical protein ACI4VG_02350 [Lachnospiraceae bacterium]